MGTLLRSTSVSRRGFLKLGALGVAGVLLGVPSGKASAQVDGLAGQFGRVLDSTLPVYPAPSRSGKEIRYVWKDLVLPIHRVTVGDNDPPYNRVWYQLGDEGYVHSGSIQPVRIDLNQPVSVLPTEGQLAEITVPYTDARYTPSIEDIVIYRLYYQTTHWAVEIQKDDQGSIWYGLFDDKLKAVYYVQARHVRLIPPENLRPISPQVPAEQKRIEVLLDHQAVVAYEYDNPVFMARTATGARFSSGNYSTEPGRYVINRKRPSRHMAAGDRAAPNSYDLPGVPWISYFTEDGISFHGTYWHNDFGKTRSHGCVNLSPAAARWIYLWTLPEVPASEQSVFETTGTIVDVI